MVLDPLGNFFKHISTRTFLSGMVACASVFFSQSSFAQSYMDLRQELKMHPSLQALGLEEKAMRNNSRAALGLPDPVISLGVNNVPISDPAFDRFLPTHKSIGVRQSIPNLAQRQANADILKGRAQMSVAQKSLLFAQLEARLIKNLADKTAVQAQISLQQEQEKKLIELEEIIASELDAGRAVSYRIADIDLESAELAREQSNLRARLAQINASLIDLVGRPVNANAPDQQLVEWSGQALDFHAVQIVAQNVTVAEHGVTAASADFGSNWGVNFTYQARESAGPDALNNFAGDDWFSAGVSFSVPLWSRGRQKPALDAARADQAASKMHFKTVVKESQREWSTLKSTIISSTEYINILAQKVAAQKERTDALLRNYESGLTSYTTVIESQVAMLKLQEKLSAEHAHRIGLIATANSYLVSS